MRTSNMKLWMVYFCCLFVALQCKRLIVLLFASLVLSGKMIIKIFVEDDLQKPKLLHETKHARCCGSIQRNVVSSFELNLFMMNVQVI